MQHGSDTLSLVGQSLSYAIQEEMSDYYRLVAVLEAQMNEKDEKDEKEEGKWIRERASAYMESTVDVAIVIFYLVGSYLNVFLLSHTFQINVQISVY